MPMTEQQFSEQLDALKATALADGVEPASMYAALYRASRNSFADAQNRFNNPSGLCAETVQTHEN